MNNLNEAKSAASPDTGTVNRALRILAALAEQERWALNELARHLQLPRASTHRLLNLCKPLGFVEQDEDGLYRAGIEFHRIAGKLTAEAPIRRFATPLLVAIRDKTQETATLTLLARAELKMFFSDVALTPNPLRYSVECNRLQPLSWGAAGQSILAFLSPEEIEEVIQRGDPSPLGQPPLAAKELHRRLARIRETGYAASLGQRAAEIQGLAVPLFDRGGRVQGNILLNIPHFRYQADKEQDYVRLLREAAADLTRNLGWSS